MDCVDGALKIFKSKGASRLVEPFTGSGAVCLNTDFPRYLLGDINDHLSRAQDRCHGNVRASLSGVCPRLSGVCPRLSGVCPRLSGVCPSL